jgi:predicted Zn-dependent peptidase
MKARMKTWMGTTLVALGLSVGALAAQVPDRSRPPELGPTPALTLPPITRTVMPNGLTLIYMPKRGVPLVQVNVVVKAGQVHDPAHRPGLAAMTAAMLDEGAGSRDALTLADAVEFLGASLSAGGGAHETTVALHTPLAQLDPALELLADVVLRPRFDGAELERQRRQRLTSMAQWHDEARAIVQVAYNAALYGAGHPYGRMFAGTPASVGAMTVADLQRFHGTYFVPNNAAVIVVGDVALDEIRPRIERLFGAWTRGAVPAYQAPNPPRAARQVLLVDKPGAAQSEIQIGLVGVPRNTPDYYALVVMNTMLGGSFSSRLNQKLREEKQYTYGARSSFAFGLLPGPFTASASVQTAVTDSALVEFLRELNDIRQPVPDEELTRARNYVALRFPGGFQAVSQIAGQLENLYLFDLPGDYFNGYVQAVLAVTAADVQRVARQYVTPDRMAIVVVGDRSKVESGIRGLRLGGMTVKSILDVLGPVPVVGSE